MGTFKNITRLQLQEFLHIVEFHHTPEAKHIIKENNERYCFGAIKATITYYPSTETLLIQGSADQTKRYTSAMESLINSTTINQQINVSQDQPPIHNLLEYTNRNFNSEMFQTLKRLRENNAQQYHHINNCISLFELNTPVMHDVETQTPEPPLQSNVS